MRAPLAAPGLVLLVFASCRSSADLGPELAPWAARAAVAAELEARGDAAARIALPGRLERVADFLEELEDRRSLAAVAWFRLAAADATDALGAHRGADELRGEVADALGRSEGPEDRLASAALLVLHARREERSGRPSLRRRITAANRIARSGSPKAADLVRALDTETLALLGDDPGGLAAWELVLGRIEILLPDYRMGERPARPGEDR